MWKKWEKGVTPTWLVCRLPQSVVSVENKIGNNQSVGCNPRVLSIFFLHSLQSVCNSKMPQWRWKLYYIHSDSIATSGTSSPLKNKLCNNCSKKITLLHTANKNHYHNPYIVSKYMGQLLQRNLQVFIFSHTIFLYFFLIFPSWSFLSIFVCSIFLDILSFLIWITCPNHLNVLFWMSFFISSPLFLIFSFFALSKIILKNLFHRLEFYYPVFFFSRFLFQLLMNIIYL